MARRRKRPVKRAIDERGCSLPTRKEVNFVRLIAGYLRYVLPVDFDRDLRFVRLFLWTFSYSGPTAPSKWEIKRRCYTARQYAWEARSTEELARHLQISDAQAALLFEYGYQKIPKRWQGESIDVDENGIPMDEAEATEYLVQAALGSEHRNDDAEPELDEILDALPDSLPGAEELEHGGDELESDLAPSFETSAAE